MKPLSIIITCIIFSALSVTAYSQDITDAALNAMKNLDYSYFHKHLSYLASDELKGRDTGSEGYAMASTYAANEFKINGLQPFGDNGTYFQEVGLMQRSIDKNSVNLHAKINDKFVNAVYGENITLLSSQKHGSIDETQDLVFVGYGNVLPDENINDYENLDVKGKTVIIALGGPKKVKSRKVNNLAFKAKNAKKNGATGIILFYPKKPLQKIIFKNIHSYLSSDMMALTDTSIESSLMGFDFKIAGLAKMDFIKNLFKLNELKLKKELKSIAKGNFASKELKSSLHCKFDVILKPNNCRNVVACLPGSDPKLKNEYLVISAHLDHVGVDKPVKGDSIYNGMWDNATGSAAIITFAKAYHKMVENSKRSVIFVCYTGEEKGLLGSSYYAKNAEIPGGKMVANLNIDMLGCLFETEDVIPLGYSHSNLSEAVEFATKNLAVKIDDNKQEEAEYIERSDQMSFIKNGVPALNIGAGYTAKDPKINAKKEVNKWMDKKYHSPSDDLNQEYSDKAFLTSMQVNFLTAYYISNSMDKIEWYPESKFYKKYVLKEKK